MHRKRTLDLLFCLQTSFGEHKRERQPTRPGIVPCMPSDSASCGHRGEQNIRTFAPRKKKWYEKRRSDASITTNALILIFQSAKIDFNVISLWLFMNLHPKISAFVVITVPYLHFSYHFLPRRESANVLFATWHADDHRNRRLGGINFIYECCNKGWSISNRPFVTSHTTGRM